MNLTVQLDDVLERRIVALPEADRHRFYSGMSGALEKWLDDVQDEAVIRDHPERYENSLANSRPIEELWSELGLDDRR